MNVQTGLIRGRDARSALPAPLSIAAGRQHTAETILRAVMQSLRDGLNDREASTIESSLPADLRPRWPKAAGSHPGLADLGDLGFLGRVQELAGSPGEPETKRIVRVVMSLLMKAMAITRSTLIPIRRAAS